MQCEFCLKPSVYRGRCVDHHCSYVEETFASTIERFSLFTKKDKLCVAVSGGKDSQLLLHLLHVNGFDVTGLLIDEGIDGYRAATIDDMKAFCASRSIPLRIVCFSEEVGTTLDGVADHLGAPPCSACGSWRRQLLNKYASEFDYVVTGHNMDDEAQTYLMNLFNGRVMLSARVGIKTRGLGFVPRVKPLYFLSEKDIRLYTLIRNFSVQEDDCPYAHLSLRFSIRDFLNELEVKIPGSKRAIVERFVLFDHVRDDQSKIDSMRPCSSCGQPALHTLCTACSLRERFVGSIPLKEQ